jgi:hypothetical protein
MNMNNEYIFFDAALRDRFMDFNTGRGISNRFRSDPVEGFVVELPSGLSDELQAVIEVEYDVLMDLQRDMLDAAEGDNARDLMGVTVTLPDGQSCVVRLPPAYGRRLIEHFSVGEIHELVSVIAQNVANPVTGPLCRKV